MASGAHGRFCSCRDCAVFRDGEVSAADLRASYEQALDVIASLVGDRGNTELEQPEVRAARAFLVAAGRLVR